MKPKNDFFLSSFSVSVHIDGGICGKIGGGLTKNQTTTAAKITTKKTM